MNALFVGLIVMVIGVTYIIINQIKETKEFNRKIKDMTQIKSEKALESQEFKDKAVEAFKYACPAYDDGREMCWLKNGESNQKCEYECKSIKEFAAKLNEK